MMVLRVNWRRRRKKKKRWLSELFDSCFFCFLVIKHRLWCSYTSLMVRDSKSGMPGSVDDGAEGELEEEEEEGEVVE
jgi:hypothetical protein